MYQHQLLQHEDSIRVIQVFGSAQEDDEARCVVSETRLSANVPYEAISYCWEGQRPTKLITCNGENLLVTENCEKILKYFRPRSASESRILWIDAICIDQTENQVQERNSQVQLMGKVFQTAENVCVWLGDPTIYAKSVSVEVQWVADRIDTMLDHIQTGRDDHLNRLLANMPSHDQHTLLPWFRRAWTMQEVAMARQVKFYFGTIVISFQDIVAICEKTSVDASWVILNLIFRAHISAKYVYSELSGRNKSGILDFLRQARELEATEPKDKVYAFHGLLQSCGMRLPRVDYAKPTAQIYRETVRAIVEHLQDISFLDSITGIVGIPDLPSWCPDLADTTKFNRQLKALGCHQRPEFSFDNNGRRFSIGGVVVDCISGRCNASGMKYRGMRDPWEAYWDWTRNEQPSEQYWIDLFNKLESSPPAFTLVTSLYNIHVMQKSCIFMSEGASISKQQVLLVNVLRWLLMNFQRFEIDTSILTRLIDLVQGYDSGVAATASGEWSKRHAHADTFAFPSAHLRLAFTDIVDQTLSNNFVMLREPEQFEILRKILLDSDLADIFFRLEGIIAMREFFKTATHGHALGIYSIHVGDQIALLPGIHTLMAIRQDGDYWRLIAPISLHDFDMDELPADVRLQQFTFI